jgi:pyruvate dehydrogenase E2 component (dihydrolipoamide acetyltransferase)
MPAAAREAVPVPGNRSRISLSPWPRITARCSRSCATFTLTNTGSLGALFDTPILLPGQVGALGVGSVVERPVVVITTDGQRVIAIRSMVYLALAYDPRIVDGADATRFLRLVVDRLDARHFSSELG